MAKKKICPEDLPYEVGFYKPPKHTQFKKGQSGNPTGRPKGHRNFKTDVLETLNEPVQIKENGRTRNVRSQAVALKRLREKALKGDARALDRLIDLARTYNNEDPVEATEATLAASDETILSTFIERQARRESAPPTAASSDDDLGANEPNENKPDEDPEDDDDWLR